MTFIISEIDKKFLRIAKGTILVGITAALARKNQVTLEEAKKHVELYLHPKPEIPIKEYIAPVIEVVADITPSSSVETEIEEPEFPADNNPPIDLDNNDSEGNTEPVLVEPIRDFDDMEFEEDLDESKSEEDIVNGDTEPPQSMAAPKKDKKNKKEK